MYNYDTVSEAINGLAERGYTLDFSLRNDHIFCNDQGVQLRPDDFVIDEVYRFEGYTNPDDESIVYAISSTDNRLKGTLVNAYGTYADTASEELVSKLKIRRKDA